MARLERQVRIIKSYIDIHSHILPGLDDGAENLEMSIKMLGQASREGIGKIILTPHYKPMRRNPSAETVKKAYESLKKRIKEEKLPLGVSLGNEIYYSSEAVSALREGKTLTLAGSAYALPPTAGGYVLVWRYG